MSFIIDMSCLGVSVLKINKITIIKKMKKLIQSLLLSVVVCMSLSAQLKTSAQIEELNTQTFKEKVWNFEKNKSFTRISKIPVIIDFHATWCRPCKMLAPHLQNIQNAYLGKIIIYKIDVDKDPEIAKLFDVKAMPTIVFMPDKTHFKTEVGYREYADLKALVDNYFFKK